MPIAKKRGRPKKMHTVFVYGTLREGHRNHQRFMGTAKQIVKQARVPGFMVDLGGFPGAKFDDESKGYILGEIYEVDSPTLDRLDSLEGYDSDAPKLGLYNRITVEASVPTGYMQALAYEYNGRTDSRHLIEGGDYNNRERK